MWGCCRRGLTGGNSRVGWALACRAAQQAAAHVSRLLSVKLLASGTAAPPHPVVAVIHTTSCRDFYCHSVGHYLGLDVHDTNTIGPYRTLEPGVVLAIEPGLYIPNHPQFGPYAGIGVRIEDDVFITQTGCEVGSWVGAGVVAAAHGLRKSPSATRVAPMRVITTPPAAISHGALSAYRWSAAGRHVLWACSCSPNPAPFCLRALLCVCRCCLLACLLRLMRLRHLSTHQWRQQAAHCGAQAHQAAAARVNPRSRPWQRQRPWRDAAALRLLRSSLGPVPACGQPGPGDLLGGLSAAPMQSC